MSTFAVQLSPQHLGADVLVHLARQRLTGVVSFATTLGENQLHLRDGRPESGQMAGKAAPPSRPEILTLVRTFCCAERGPVEFTPHTVDAQPGLGIDTLGEVLLAVLQTMPAPLLETSLRARGACKLEVLPLFDRLAAAVLQFGNARVSKPNQPITLSAWVKSQPADSQRACAALVILGAFKMEGWALQADGPQTHSDTLSGAVPGSLESDIVAAHGRLPSQSHYEFLGISKSASPEVVRQAYFEHAKRWHVDRLVGQKLTELGKQYAADLFHRAEQANRVLCDPAERKNYDWTCERQAQGLPTDPKIIMQAEGLFRRGETLVRRGQPAAAEAILREAMELNRGEPEFATFLAFAVYGARGKAGVDEARALIKQALAVRDNLDTGYEFLGRIAHSEGDHPQALQCLNRALELNPKNTFAERELRLMNLRAQEQKKGSKDKGLLGKLLGR